MTEIIDVEGQEIDQGTPRSRITEPEVEPTKDKQVYPRESVYKLCNRCMYRKRIKDQEIEKQNARELNARIQKEERIKRLDKIREKKISLPGGFGIPVILIALLIPLIFIFWPLVLIIIFTYMIVRGPEYDD